MEVCRLEPFGVSVTGIPSLATAEDDVIANLVEAMDGPGHGVLVVRGRAVG